MNRAETPRVFISHISDEADLAELLKERLTSDFLGMVDVFVSSDEVSVEVGTFWLEEIKTALQTAALELILCSEASINRPWINFEAGAGWLRGIPIVPICHTGFNPKDLPMPLSVLTSVRATEESSLKKLYNRIAATVQCNVPNANYADLVSRVKKFESDYVQRMKSATSNEEAKIDNAKARMYAALKDKRFEWRSLNRLAIIGGVTASEALDILRRDPNIKFDLSDSGLGRIVQLLSQ